MCASSKTIVDNELWINTRDNVVAACALMQRRQHLWPTVVDEVAADALAAAKSAGDKHLGPTDGDTVASSAPAAA